MSFPVPEQPVIELQNVTQIFGSQTILQDVSLQVQSGETLVLIGESGCGKSVTMKLMMALLQPTRGQVIWNGRPVNDRNETELVHDRLKFGYLFQGAALFDSLTIFENVAFGLRQNTRMKDKQIEQVVCDRLQEVGLPKHVATRKPAELSGGMKKRVGLARALALRPDVMFYDEPTTGLDPIMSDVINELILRVREQRPVTSIVVTHDMRTVEKIADRIVMFFPKTRLGDHDPQIIFEGQFIEALESPDPRVSQFVRGEARERLEEILVS